MFMFSLALELGMTVAELAERMTPAELSGWSLFYEIKNEREKKEREKAMRRRR